MKEGGGSGTFDPMEARVAQIEKDMAEVKSDLKSLLKDVAHLKGEVSRLPGYPGLIVICGTMAAIIGLVIRFLPAG